MNEYEAVIGLEIHAEMLTSSKAFCSCEASFGGEPNTKVCPVCIGMPGSLPVVNEKMVDLALKVALATNCKIADKCKFDRKNYFYPDLPKGYQISQYDQPLGEHGWLEINLNNEKKKINITRVHMEEDTGKLVHAGAARLAGSSYSLVDLNRAGIPLLEIVSEPEIRSGEEARIYAQELRNIFLYTDVCDGKMEEGSMRCEANVSVRKKGTTTLGTKVEIKNLNSFRSLEKSLDYEIIRQIELLNNGGEVDQETRLWDENKNSTFTMRGKESAKDYRYFPEPDLPPLRINAEWVKRISDSLPEMPYIKRERYINEMDLSFYDADVIVFNQKLAGFFDQTVSVYNNPKIVANWIMGDISSYLNDNKINIDNTKITPDLLSQLLILQDKEIISGKIAKSLIVEILQTGESPEKLVEKKGLTQISNPNELIPLIKEIVIKNPKQVEEIKEGKIKLMAFFVGQVMKETKGRANPELVNKLVKDVLQII